MAKNTMGVFYRAREKKPQPISRNLRRVHRNTQNVAMERGLLLYPLSREVRGLSPCQHGSLRTGAKVNYQGWPRIELSGGQNTDMLSYCLTALLSCPPDPWTGTSGALAIPGQRAGYDRPAAQGQGMKRCR